ncbi:anti-sigma factor antagonist [Leptospira sp. 96542]|nr:anti-sigma factor antagonist [Leptospira sp. 96542]
MLEKTNAPDCFKVGMNRLDVYTTPILESEMALIFQKDITRLYLDFSEVEEVSSSVLGLLLHKKMFYKKMGKELCITNVLPPISKLLKILNLSNHLLT